MQCARECNGVIINADSQQVYRDLRILTARPSEAEEAEIPHKLYGFVSADEAFSAGKWLKFAKMEIDWALSMGITPIICGGTGMYIKSLMEGIAEIPDIPEAVRAQAENDYEQMGKEEFIKRLREIDPAFFERLKVTDRQRLIRAYSVWLGSAKTLSWWQACDTTPTYPKEVFKVRVIERPREELYARCDARFMQMVEQGALEETKYIQILRLPESLPIMKTIGLREFSAYLNKEISLETAISQAQQATRNYAKRQMTWFRNQLPR